MTFTELGLHEQLLKALNASGYTNPTPVQQQAIPLALTGQDLMVSSQTGSGKTAAFMLPSLQRLASEAPRQRAAAAPAQKQGRNRRKRFSEPQVRLLHPAQPKMLVLTPTRELALQVTAATEKYGRYLPHIKAVAILGGMPYPKQISLLAQNPDILVATPGRLLDHLDSGKIDFSLLQIMVLDEADRMLDMGFIDDIEKIVSMSPETRQTWLFSATLDGEVGNIAKKFTRNAQIIRVNPEKVSHDHISQRLYFVDNQTHKHRLLDHFLRDETLDQAIVFTATRRDADTISDRLNLAGFSVAALHGDMPQGARNRTLNALRRKAFRILVATDVAARGIDIPSVTHVVNYDLPKFAEDYVHRIGRTGRAGRSGLAISLANHGEQFSVRKIERFTRQSIPVEVVEGFEPQSRPAARPAKSKHRSQARPTGAGFTEKAPWGSKGNNSQKKRTSAPTDSRPAPSSSGKPKNKNSRGHAGKPWAEKAKFSGRREQQ